MKESNVGQISLSNASDIHVGKLHALREEKYRYFLLSASQPLLLGGVLLTSFLLRLPYLGQTSLRLDEMWSIGTSRMPWRSILSVVLHQDSNASLYYVVLHLW